MTIGTVITGGFGSFGSAPFVITYGFSIAEESAPSGRSGRGRVTPRQFTWHQSQTMFGGANRLLKGVIQG